MQNILDAVSAWYHADPERALLALGTVILLLLPWWLVQWWRQSAWRRAQAQLAEQIASLQEQLLNRLETDRNHAMETMQRGFQGVQLAMADRIGALELELLKDASSTRMALFEHFEAHKQTLGEALADTRLAQQREAAGLRQTTQAMLTAHREGFEQVQREAIARQQETLAATLGSMGRQVQEAFRESSEQLGKRVELLTRTTDGRLQEISGQVEKRLSEGFEKTTATFTRVLEHLSRIDEAQKKITELSGSVVSLQEVLIDKRSRGAFGEVQLISLVRNLMPEGSYQEQATLSNGRRVDCLLRLPDPTGNVPIDAKFPLESYQRMTDVDLPAAERSAAVAAFRRDIRKHIADIAQRYLIPGETADGAVMFIPAESIFAEIHAHYPELVAEAQRVRVWMVSPTTLMAVMTTARAVLKDDATRKQVHVIQEHLRRLAEDFSRFQARMDKLSSHIDQAHRDVGQIHLSARKISGRFEQIDQVELSEQALEKPQPG